VAMEIGIQLTSRCNLSCDHCFQERSDEDIPLDLLDRILPFAKAHRCSSFSLTGGGPTLHPSFPEILARLSGDGIKVSLTSNGWNFADIFSGQARLLEALGFVSFSLDGSNGKNHDRCRASGSFRRVLEAARICRSAGVPFGFQMTLSCRNIEDVGATARLASQEGARQFLLIPLLPTPRSDALGMLPGTSELERVREEVTRLKASLLLPIPLAIGFHEENPLILCPALTMRSLFVTARGEVGFCCQLAGYGGQPGGREILGHIGEISLYEAHRRTIAAVAALLQDKVRRLEGGLFGEADFSPCRYCLRFFGKDSGMAEIAGSRPPRFSAEGSVGGGPSTRGIG
jgi:MoaA/NifB/PqqE/SkfB family radical SAM enzyme